MKKIDRLIVVSFIGPYILSFFIAEFVLIMQFLWKYIDEILGKGFSIFEIMELVFYYGLTIVPMALPISILIASVMVFGNISEKNELSSMKSAGVSLIRVMLPGIAIALLTAMFSLFASNYLKPASNFQFKKRFDYIRRQKSNLAIEEGVFNNDFRSYVIRVGKKEKNGIDVKDVLIYDHTLPDKSLVNMIVSDSATMYTTERGNYFVMSLKNGNYYQEGDRAGSDGKGGTYPMTRTHFSEWTKVFDMSEFHLSENDININRNREDMLNTFQLLDALDTFSRDIKLTEARLTSDYASVRKVNKNGGDNYENVMRYYREEKKKLADLDSMRLQKEKEDERTLFRLKLKYGKQYKSKLKVIPSIAKSLDHVDNPPAKHRSFRSGLSQLNLVTNDTLNSFYETFDSAALQLVLPRADAISSAKSDNAGSVINTVRGLNQQKEIYKLRMHQQYSFAMICIIFMFIGAPLGSIIRKGGYGYPLLVAILFYMMFVISTILGEKLLKNETFFGLFAAWLPCLIQLPFALFFSYKALNDAKFNGFEKLEMYFMKLFGKIQSDEQFVVNTLD